MDQDRAADSFAAAFGLAVVERRHSLGISQEELSFRADVDRSYLSAIERGLQNPSLKLVWKLAAALETKPTKLIAATEGKMR